MSGAPDLFELFLSESEELLRQFEDALMGLEERAGDREVVHQLFRAVHTLKGNAGIVGFDRMVEFAHVLESVLERLRAGEVTVTRPFVSVLLQCKDVLATFVAEAAAGRRDAPLPAADSLVPTLRRFLGVGGAEETSLATSPAPASPRGDGQACFRVTLRFRPDLLETGQEPFLLVDELLELGRPLEVVCDVSTVPGLDEMAPERLYLAWDVTVATDRGRAAVDQVFLFVAFENEITVEDVTARWLDGVRVSDAERKLGEIPVDEGHVSRQVLEGVLGQQKRLGTILVESGVVAPAVVEQVVARQEAARSLARRSSIRVETEKLDRLVNLVGELVIAVSQMSRSVRDPAADQEARLGALEALDQIGRDVQEEVMGVRMVPVEELFLRFKRVVRDLAQDLGKEARLEVEGVQTELDKNVVEHLADPLKHLVRNCVDHGLETPAERRAAGKPDAGLVRLRAAQQEGQIVIEVADDGHGIDRARVVARARERGLLGDRDREPTVAEIHEFLFAPGFSTAAAVTDISGRGVGLDVVRRNIAELRGTVEVISEEGRGTTFRIVLPLTLAIIEGIMAQVGDETFTVPLLSVVEQLRPRREHLRTVQGRGEVVAFRDEFVPLLRLHRVFNLSATHVDPTRGLVMVIDGGARRYGLLVDDVLGQEQAVIKSLADNFRQVDGVAGATILGDGRVSLILDVRGLERLAFSPPSPTAHAPEAPCGSSTT